VRRNCEHLLALVNNNLELARIEAGQLTIERKPEDVSALVEDVVSTMRIMADEKRLALVLKPGQRLPDTLSVDPIRVRQVLINLLGNAIKFTERGEVELAARWGAGTLEIDVRDSGVGIPLEALPYLFEPFRRGVGERATGTGLGLAITRRLVDLMGGTIRASSVPGKGTTFEVRIPAAKVAPAVSQRLPAQPVLLAPLSGKVLVAEDNENLRDLFGLYLHELGLECRIVGNGFDAVEAAFADEFDVLLMDMEMPVMDGYEAAHVLRARGYRGPIIALTAHQEGLEIERAKREGCDSIVRKPVTAERLREVLGPLLAGRGALRAAGAQN
jgi:CheY-like chemotaxis protein/anti-sigma regulatory factor (Ser/Thr protein kinase)